MRCRSNELQELDRFALARYAEVAAKVLRAYEAYDFPAVPQAINNLITADISAFYVDVSKDRLYTLAPNSPARRSAQTAMSIMADGLARLIAPILPMTADELWRFLPGSRDESVHLADFPTGLETLLDPALTERWQRLMQLRDAVNVEIERLRKAKVVGKSLEARVELRATGDLRTLLARHRDDLPTLFITSDVILGDAPADGEGTVYRESETSYAAIVVSRAGGVRCDRCWRYVPAVSSDAARPGLCPRCEDALAETRP